MAKSYDHLFKLLLIGDSDVGKPQIILRFCNICSYPAFVPTIGIDFKIKTTEIDGKKIKLQIWDTSGQERFKSVSASYFRGAKGVMIVYDITNEKSFDSIRTWIQRIKEHASEDMGKIIVGTKCEMQEERQVSKEMGEQLAIGHGIKFMEISTESSANVEEAFFTLVRDIMSKMDTQTHASEDMGKIIVGTKCEMQEERQVSKEMGEQLAIGHGIKFMEISTESSANVEEAFFTLVRDIMSKMDTQTNVAPFTARLKPDLSLTKQPTSVVDMFKVSLMS